MKISQELKWTLLSLLGLLYLTGTTKWILKTFFQTDLGMGPEPLPAEIWILRMHGTLSFAVLVLIGYVLRAHVVSSLKMQKGKKSGLTLLAHLFLLILSAPFLMYLTDEKIKGQVEFIHAVLGMTLIGSFLIHFLTRKER